MHEHVRLGLEEHEDPSRQQHGTAAAAAGLLTDTPDQASCAYFHFLPGPDEEPCDTETEQIPSEHADATECITGARTMNTEEPTSPPNPIDPTHPRLVRVRTHRKTATIRLTLGRTNPYPTSALVNTGASVSIIGMSLLKTVHRRWRQYRTEHVNRSAIDGHGRTPQPSGPRP